MIRRSAILKPYVVRQSRLLLKLVGIPLVCAAMLAAIVVYAIGGTDLLGYAGSQLLTRAGMRHVLIVFVGLALFTWARHVAWYADEPPPMWFRRSIWLTVLELSILIGLVFVAAWAIPRFAAPR